MGYASEKRCEEKRDQLPELPRLGAGFASGGWGMHWLHTRVNRSRNVVTASSCVLGKGKEGDVYSFFPATALKMQPLHLFSSVCICSVEAGLKFVFKEKHGYCSLVLAGSVVKEKIKRSWISS